MLREVKIEYDIGQKKIIRKGVYLVYEMHADNTIYFRIYIYRINRFHFLEPCNNG